jgi:hypothetical protein
MGDRQVINLDIFGRPSGLVHKDFGINLTKIGGRQEVTRVSDILWDEDRSMWYVMLLTTTNKGMSITDNMFGTVSTNDCNNDGITNSGVLLFNDHGVAVDCEVNYFQGIEIKNRV